MKAAEKKGPESAGVFKIGKISWLDRCRLGARSRHRDLALAGRLAVWNQELWSPERILKALGLSESDLEPLKALGGRRDGWHPFEFDARAGAEAGRLAALGLVRLGRWRRRISLTGAGRILLLLTDIDPEIKKIGQGREKKD